MFFLYLFLGHRPLVFAALPSSLSLAAPPNGGARTALLDGGARAARISRPTKGTTASASLAVLFPSLYIHGRTEALSSVFFELGPAGGMASYAASRSGTYRSQAKKGSGSRTVKGMGRANTKKARSRNKTRMPLCTYGAACRRKGCVYRHPPRSSTGGGGGGGASHSGSGGSGPALKVCPHFLAGLCEYGNQCMNRHPSEEECRQTRAMFAAQVCRNGDACATVGCLYSHPGRERAAAAAAAAANSSLSTGAAEWVPSFMQRCPPAPPDPTLVPQSWPRADAAVVGTPTWGSGVLTATGAAGATAAAAAPPPAKKQIPVDLWTPSYLRNPAMFQIADPIKRFGAVNRNAAEGVVDLHYQTVKSCWQVLDLVLPQYAGYGDGVWVVTGTGNHRGGHQAEGVLYAEVRRYCADRGYTYKIGKDSAGGQSGALFVHVPAS